MTYKIEPFIETVSGKEFHFLDPKPEDIEIEDIAYSLANQCRFTGHVPFYSVAEHSLLVSAQFADSGDKQLMLAALLHDASEAYLSDIASPIKQFLPEYTKMEDKLQTAIYNKFNVDYNKYAVAVKQADIQQLYNEAHYLLKSGGKTWKMFEGKEFSPQARFRPSLLHPRDAFTAFMEVFTYVTEKDTPRIIV